MLEKCREVHLRGSSQLPRVQRDHMVIQTGFRISNTKFGYQQMKRKTSGTWINESMFS